MTSNRNRTTTAAAILGLALALSQTKPAGAQTEFFDDFNDGNDNGWEHVDLTRGTPWGPGVYDASSQAYLIESSGEVPPGAATGIDDSLFARHSRRPFTDGFLQTDVHANSEGHSVSLVLREGRGLSYFFNADTGKDELRISKVTDGGQTSTFLAVLNPAPFPLVAGEDWTMKAGAFGDQLSLKIWRINEPEPSAPQLVATDSLIKSGHFGIGVSVPSDFIGAVQPSATFDNVRFFVPEPSASLLGSFGFLTLLCHRRKRKPR